MNSDTKHHRFVTAISFLFACLLYVAMRAGAMGDSLARFAATYLIIALAILGGRAVFTELGIRRKRAALERRVK
jgi:integral membrane sensor domain MASE1